MSQAWSDIIFYGVPFVTGVAGVITGHKVTLNWIKKSFAKAEPLLTKIEGFAVSEFPKAEEVAGHIYNAIKELIKAPVVAAVAHHVEAKAEKEVTSSRTVQLVNFALIALVRFGKSLTDMNDAEKYAVAQFVLGSFPAEEKATIQAADIVHSMDVAQKLLDSAAGDPLLQKAFELTNLAQAFTDKPVQNPVDGSNDPASEQGSKSTKANKQTAQ